MCHVATDNLWHFGDDDDIYTTFNGIGYDSDEDVVYVTDNIDASGFAYAIGNDNKVISLFDSGRYAKGTYCDDLYFHNGHLYIMIHGSTEKDSKDINAYTILELDSKTMKPLAHTGWFTPYGCDDLTRFTCDGEYFYITGISADDMIAQVYAISLDELCLIADTDDTNIRNVATIRYSLMAEPSEGYHLVYAYFEDGELSTMENGNGIFTDSIYSDIARERFENKEFSAKQIIALNRTTVIILLFITLAGILFILAMCFFVKKRNRVAYMIVIWEVMLAIVLGFTGTSLYQIYKQVDWDDLIYFTSFTLQDVRDDLEDLERQYELEEDYYRTEEYRNISDRLRKVINEYGNGEVYDNALCITTKNGGYHVIAAAEGLDNCELDKLYGNEAVNLVKDVHETGERTKRTIVLDGVSYALVCVGNIEETNPTSMLLAVVKQEHTNEKDLVNLVVVAICVFFIFVFASVVGIIVLLRQSKDLKLLGNTMLDVSQGGIGIEKPNTLGEDMSDMWSGLLDIDRNFKNLSYIKYRTFEAYYKFAPKSVEKLLGKTSITEVANGDMVKKNGTIVLMSTVANKILDGLSKSKDLDNPMLLGSKSGAVLSAISKHQEDNSMFKIASTSDFTEMQLLMPETTKDASRIGTELSSIYQDDGYGVCLFLHYTEYLYGVAVAGEEASQFLLAGDIIRMRENIKLLNELGLAQVITNTVYDRELEKPNCRNIGYWEFDTNQRFDLYEVLDAYDDEKRHRREDTRTLFEEGLKLFHDRKFYLARNNFAKVLKVDYSDSVARWYLFVSEKYLEKNSDNVTLTLSE